MAEGVRKRGKTWSYYFDTAKINGERNKVEKGGFRTQKEASEARAAAIAEYKSMGRTFVPNEMSVADYLDYWLENAIKKNVDHGYSWNTYINYRDVVRNHLKPAFGIYRLSVIQSAPDVIQRWIDDQKKKYSKKSISSYLGCLSSALSYAVVPLQYIKFNPCALVKIGRMKQNPEAKIKSEYVLSPEEYQRIVEHFSDGTWHRPAITVPYNCGTRISETFAIDLLHDIDYEKHTLSINKQIMKVADSWGFKAPKYDSFRTIVIGPTLEHEFREAARQQKLNRMRYGQFYLRTYVLPDSSIIQVRADINVSYKEIMPLCVNDDGSLATPESFKYLSKLVHEKLGNPYFHSHCLRHTHGTILAENGVNPKTVMERLGHKSIATTLQTYTFNTAAMQENAVELFENATNAV